MNLGMAEIAELPLAAAALGRDGGVIARTPDWQGGGPGTVSYPVRSVRLLVAAEHAPTACEPLLHRLLDVLDGLEDAASGPRRSGVAVLAASLRILAGREVLGRGTARNVLELARDAIGTRTGLEVEVQPAPDREMDAPLAAALVLVQFAVNAERHEGAARVVLRTDGLRFDVAWPGLDGPRQLVTARRQGGRNRWGLGFARIAADTLGGALQAPRLGPDGLVSATLELGVPRLTLPIAGLRDGKVLRATRAWDEETGLMPGTQVAANERLATLDSNARARPGTRVGVDGWWARASRDLVWVAVPPDGVVDRARDVLRGLAHERALWEDVDDGAYGRVVALSALLGAALGDPLTKVPARAWNRGFPEACAALDVRVPAVRFEGLEAVDPWVVAYLAGDLGDEVLVDDDGVGIAIRSHCLDDPLIAPFPLRDGVLWL